MNPQRLALRSASSLLVLLLPFQLCAQEAQKDTEPLARQLVTRLQEKRYAEVTAMFDDTMRGLMPEAKVGEIWRMLQFRYGAFKSQGAARYERVEDYDVIYVGSVFDRASLDTKVVFDSARRVTGLFFVPASGQPAPQPPPAAPSNEPDDLDEVEVTVESGDFRLPGILALPRADGPHPAALLVAGSGPNDRDSTLGPNKPLRDIAHGLARHGVASLRYDKRTKIYGLSLDVKNLTWQEEVADDALAAIRLLRKDARVDPDRVFLVGHSLGGHLAPAIAAQARTSYLGQEKISIGGGLSDSLPLPDSIPLPGSLPFGSGNLLAGIVIMAGPARQIVPLIMDQLAHIALADGQMSPQERASIMNFKAGAAALLEGGGDNRPAVMGLTRVYLKALNDYDPIAAMKGVHLPFLILQGGRDYQVSPKLDFEAWKAALSGRKDGTLKLYPKLNHLFMEGEGVSYPAEYMTPARVSDEVILNIADWIKAPDAK